jgi:hypothetical protein
MLSTSAAKLKHVKHRLGLIVIVSFLAYAFFPYMTVQESVVKFNSPDETANWFTASQIAQGDDIGIRETLNLEAENIIHPRSMSVVGDRIVPTSFLGLPVLYGVIGLLTSLKILPYLTALITSLSLLAAYQVWRHYFSERISIISTVLWAFQPALWYYASRGFYHNVLFVDLLIIAWWLYLTARDRQWNLDWLLAFLVVLGAVVIVRTNEIIWIAPIVLVAIWSDRKTLGFKHLVVMALTFIIGTAGWFWLNQAVQEGLVYQAPGIASSRLQVWLNLLWPFGFDIFALGISIQNYFIVLFAPLWVFIWIAVIKNYQNIKQFSEFKKQYIGITIFVACWLILYYGSWGVVDTVGESGATIGNSHVRYWLPIFFLLSPFVSAGVETLSQWLSREQRRLISSALVLLMIGYGFVVTYFDKHEGLVYISSRLSINRGVALYADKVLPKNAIILSDRSDKVFFPERRVISPGDRPYYTFPEVMQGLPVILDNSPVYVYSRGLFDSSAAEELGQRGIIIGETLPLPDGGWLYQLIKL